MDEARSMSMMGGSRLIRITDATEGITTHLKTYLEEPSSDNLIVIEASELTARSKLRQLCEKSDSAAAIPCYVEDERSLSNLIRKELQDAGLMASRDAISWLALELKGDRQRARSEIEKLITYMGDKKHEISLDDATACCGKGSDQSLDDLVYSLTGNNPEKAMRVYNQLLDEDVAIISIIRSCLNHFRRLHLAKARQANGEALPQVMKTLSPPVFFKYTDQFSSHVQRWSMGAIESAMIRLSSVEKDSKKTGTPVKSLFGQTLLSLSLR
jgi:DNA polymerase-3 subunit delta